MVVREIREPDAMVAPVRCAGAVVPEEWRDMMMRPDRRRNMFPIGAQVVVQGPARDDAAGMAQCARISVAISSPLIDAG
ncbi:hypothetical protein BW10_10040 [Bifidobacterium sp. UTBIF-56]|nr:hypothetical protein BW09_08685 [Bifidobacterium sp. UTCIF-1]TPF79512.1 hypothetical protein BW08_09510 [Bifidobacterium sp. UTCIF-24]TPF88297.1 hypothetical protein BW10_10040 [Bifidobacterium sp. UTBIF-56]TPF94163.1 hypothetical protein BW14_02375 [Bifidobacterium sp. UTBIF-68]